MVKLFKFYLGFPVFKTGMRMMLLKDTFGLYPVNNWVRDHLYLNATTSPQKRSMCFREADVQMRFPPHDVHMTLAFPVQVLVHQFHVILPMHFGHYERDFHQREAGETKSQVSCVSRASVSPRIEERDDSLPSQAPTWTERKRLAGLLHIGAGRIGPSIWFELKRLVEILRIMRDGPGACVYFHLRI